MSKRRTERFEFESICFDSGSGEPRYVQLENQVRRAISSGLLKPGMKVPSSRSLAKAIGVSRNTVITAYDQLVSEGFLDSTTGSGTRVASMPPEVFENKSPANTSHGRQIGTEVLSSVGKELSEESTLFPMGPISAEPFLPHVPAVDEFPLETWNRLSYEQSRWTTAHLTLCEPQGYQPLRQSVAEYMAVSRDVSCTADQIVITSGGQQAANLVGQLLLNPKDSVWVEDPGNSPANKVLELNEANLIGIPLDNEGINIKEGELLGNPKLIYVTPGGQWPLGMTMSLNRRLELLKLTQRVGSWVLEDDYNGEFRYKGRPLPALSSLDQSGRTIYMGTFSKMLFPGIRLAFLVVPPSLAKTFAYAKWLQDRGAPSLNQMVLHRFIESGKFLKHLRKMRTLYAERQSCLFEELKKKFGADILVQRPESGMHMVVRGRTKRIESRLVHSAEQARLQFHPVMFYSRNPSSDSARGMILGFAAYDLNRIKNAVRRWFREYSKT